MNNAIEFSKLISAMAITLSLLCASCDKKEKDGKLTVMTKPITEITTTSAKSGGDVSATGNFSVGVCGVCWSEIPSPTTNDLFTSDNQGIGEYSSSIRNLSPNTKYYLRAYATTSSGIIYGEELSFYTEALPQAAISVFTNEVTEITSSTAKCGGVISAIDEANIIARGVCWNTSPNPIVNDAHTSDGQGAGAFSSNLAGLSNNTTYYIKAYAKTFNGEIFYGEEKTFTTDTIGGSGGENEIVISVYTNEVSEINSSSAKCGGVITTTGDANITKRGVCWGTSTAPTISGNHTIDGQGLGAFTSVVTNLTPNTNYYIRAYATSIDESTIYGDTKSFQTGAEHQNAELPSVIIGEVSNITGTSASCSGYVTNDGGASVTERGFCWNTSTTPMVYHSRIACGDGVGNFSANITGLENGTTYYIRAYATNNEGTKYSNEELVFETHNIPTVITHPLTQISQKSATFSGEIANNGGFTISRRGFCWGTEPNPTLENSPNITANDNGTGVFSKLVSVLSPNTHYYVRAYAKNSLGVGYGDNLQFTTLQVAEDTYLHYGDENFTSSWGLAGGGEDEWAVMFPSSMLTPYEGTTITKIRTYLGETGTYTLKIYEGGDNEPATLVRNLQYTITETGWRNLLLTGYEVPLIVRQNLWISLSLTYEAGHYPAGAGAGINNPNVRWKHGDDGWYDVYAYNENQDLCWLIEAFVTGNAKYGNYQGEIPLQPSLASQHGSELSHTSSSNSVKKPPIKRSIINRCNSNYYDK